VYLIYLILLYVPALQISHHQVRREYTKKRNEERPLLINNKYKVTIKNYNDHYSKKGINKQHEIDV
jgi:hypothetical protein